MWIEETKLKGCYVITPRVFKDERGLFMETYNKLLYSGHEFLDIHYVQDNLSVSKKNTVRGLHFQRGQFAQAKLVSVAKGSVMDVVVDIRPNSKTFGEHISVFLTEENRKQLFVPRGFAHGFVALEDDTIFTYKCDNFYNKESESGIIYNDADLGIDWMDPNEELIVSEKDLLLPNFKNLKL